MRARVAAAAAVVALAGLPAARANGIFDLHVGVRAGGATGSGLGGAQKDNDFFAGAKGAAYGAVVGLEIVFIDLFVEHDQLTSFDKLNGTWTQFMIGPHFNFALNEARPGGKAHLDADLGLAFGYGVGTGRQIDPPLDNAQVSDKGFLIEFRGGLEYRMTPAFGLGVSVPLAWGYMTKNGVPVNDTSNHYQTFRAMVVGTLTVHAGF